MKFETLRPFEEFIILVMEFFTSKVTDPKYFDRITEFGKNYPLLKSVHNHDEFLRLGYLSKNDFIYYASDNRLVESIPIQVLDLILEALVDNLIVLKIEPYSFNNTVLLFSVNGSGAKYYASNKQLLLNKLFGFNYIIEKYISSVFKIENVKDGKPEIGNGFLIEYNNRYFILTNQHVVENSDKLSVKNQNEEILEYNDVVEDNENDLAIIILKKPIQNVIPFLLNFEIKILEEIMTIGYPPIPTTKASYPLFHLGEVNSFVESYWGNSLFIYSAKTNPGNSGSPIIDRKGMIVGVVTQQLEEKEWYKKSKIPYYAGIPSQEIIRFLNSINIKNK